ncbi:SCO family protein [Pseudoxanthomonas sp. JBR18]|uniref:SCO family protein n=1 Tax=Pseudoxanthomonas sp. JBR18 TaxID=2969308 RepID=UPI002306A084|nr:SCO family protein [Pseudoxanthomonas sp. JBR18]WCE03327.1 SCO family protein [Pseudoxanthomonas sp. JBR18]
MGKRSFGVLILIVAAGILGVLAANKLLAPSKDGDARWPATQAVTLLPRPRVLPEFSLRQADGTQLTQGELRGHWTLVFLGFTFCPDVCPTTLAQLAQAQKQWAALPDSIRPRLLFVSIDPERDTPTKVGEYAHAFHPDTLAATADVPALEAFAKSLSLVFVKVPGEHFKQNPQDYSMDHSAQIVVLDPQGRMAGLIQPPFDPAAIGADMLKLTEAMPK